MFVFMMQRERERSYYLDQKSQSIIKSMEKLIVEVSLDIIMLIPRRNDQEIQWEEQEVRPTKIVNSHVEENI